MILARQRWTSIMKYKTVRDCMRKKSKDLEKNLSVKVRAGGDFGVDVGRDFEVLSDGKMDSFFGKL